MSVVSHVDIPQGVLPDLTVIEGLDFIGGHIPYSYLDSAAVAFNQDDDGVWTASIWPISGDGRSEALALAQQFRLQGAYAWAYSQAPDEPLDSRFGPRRPEAA